MSTHRPSQGEAGGGSARGGSTGPAAAAIALSGRAMPAVDSGTIGSLVELTKPRITRLVVITAGVGFVLGALGRRWETLDLVLSAFGTLFGTALSSAGASALNQWWERSRDGLMVRTSRRPLPDGRLSPALAVGTGLALSAVGVLLLLTIVGPAPALISLVTILLYVLVYTPLKPITPVATLIGTIPGALPPLIGWTAAAGVDDWSIQGMWETLSGPGGAGGWVLFVLMVVWQVPHFLAIAWMHREDYARGGYRMLPLDDDNGGATGAVVLLWAGALVPVTMAPALVMPDRLGWLYVAVAAAIGIPFFLAAARLAVRRTRGDARTVFFASIIHLPLVLMAMVADALIGAVL